MVEIVRIKISFLSYYNLIPVSEMLKLLFKTWKEKRKALHSESYNYPCDLKEFVIVPIYRKKNKTDSVIFEGT
jgi:hypothetical protein